MLNDLYRTRDDLRRGFCSSMSDPFGQLLPRHVFPLFHVLISQASRRLFFVMLSSIFLSAKHTRTHRVIRNSSTITPKTSTNSAVSKSPVICVMPGYDRVHRVVNHQVSTNTLSKFLHIVNLKRKHTRGNRVRIIFDKIVPEFRQLSWINRNPFSRIKYLKRISKRFFARFDRWNHHVRNCSIE